MKIALAIFVKTPGYSEVKTRLAASIGRLRAHEFYLRSIKAIESVALELKNSSVEIEPIWALAESESLDHPLWEKLDRIYQGEGDLGQRLSCIHDQLFNRFDIVYFIGADSPHLSVTFLKNSILNFLNERSSSFQLGEAFDGGFYILGMKIKIPSSVWTSITYSSDTTSMQLKDKILNFGTIDEIKKEFDVDIYKDLLHYKEDNFEIINATNEQVELIKWVKTNF